MDAGDDDEERDDNGGETFYLGAMFCEFVVAGELFADYYQESSDGVDKTMNGIRCDGEGSGSQPDDNVEDPQNKIDCDK